MAEVSLLAAGRASNPTLATDARSGVSYVAWVETGEQGSNVVLARIEDGAAPSAPVRVNDTPGDCHGFEIELEDCHVGDVPYTEISE